MKKCGFYSGFMLLSAYFVFLLACGEGEVTDIPKFKEMKDAIEDRIDFCGLNPEDPECPQPLLEVSSESKDPSSDSGKDTSSDSKDTSSDSKDPSSDSKDPSSDSKDPSSDSKDPSSDSKDPSSNSNPGTSSSSSIGGGGISSSSSVRSSSSTASSSSVRSSSSVAQSSGGGTSSPGGGNPGSSKDTPFVLVKDGDNNSYPLPPASDLSTLGGIIYLSGKSRANNRTIECNPNMNNVQAINTCDFRSGDCTPSDLCGGPFSNGNGDCSFPTTYFINTNPSDGNYCNNNDCEYKIKIQFVLKTPGATYPTCKIR